MPATAHVRGWEPDANNESARISKLDEYVPRGPPPRDRVDLLNALTFPRHPCSHRDRRRRRDLSTPSWYRPLVQDGLPCLPVNVPRRTDVRHIVSVALPDPGCRGRRVDASVGIGASLVG